jgi:hypothetical protein
VIRILSPFLVASLLVSAFAASAVETKPSSLCTDLLQLAARGGNEIDAGLRALYRRAGDPNEVSALLLQEMRTRSDALKAKLAANPGDLELRSYEYVFVGAGIHNGIVKGALNKSARDAGKDVPKVLTVEATNDISVFGRTGKTFRGNTLEHADLGKNPALTDEELREASRNIIPNAPIQVADVAKAKVPTAVEFQAPSVAQHWKEGGDFLFQSPVGSVSKVSSGPKKGWYAVRLASGETVYAENVVLATGVGKGRLPTKDPASVAFIASEAKKSDPKVVFVEDMLERLQDESETTANFTRKYAGKDIIVMGGGHGGAIGIEPLEGMAPAALYRNMGGASAVEKPRFYLWVNLKASSGEEFKKVIGGGDRYFALAPLIDSGRIRTNQFYVGEVLPGKTKAVKVSFIDKATGQPVRDASGAVVYEEADYVIYAVGYEPINPTLVRDFGKPVFEPVTGPITPNDLRLYHESDVTVGTQLVGADGTAENIFTAGPSAGQIPHEKDPGGKTSVTINIFGSRSESLGKVLFQRRSAK